MLNYKRNQVEEAVSRVLEPRSKEPSVELRTRLKRLLETDRELGQDASDDSDYAFFGEEPPGRGVDVWFSAYEAFALLVGLSIMAHGWPQGFVVWVLRRVRRDLERQHTRILKQDPKELFDPAAIRSKAQRGDLVVRNTDPVFLTIVSEPAPKFDDQGKPVACAACRGAAEVANFLQRVNKNGGAWSMLEVVNLAFQLNDHLAQTEPQLRGRGR